ncbi:MAG: hypothetical protein ACJ786_33865 [Catenulispora sp.]
MPENTNAITGREQLPAGVYTWHLQLTWRTRPCDVAGSRLAAALIGQPSTIDMRGQVTLSAVTSFAVVVEQLWRAAHSAESIPNTAKITKFTLHPAGGAR